MEARDIAQVRRAYQLAHSVIGAYAAPLSVVVMVWIIFGGKALFGVDIIPSHTEAHTTSIVELVIAIAATLIAFFWYLSKAAKYRALSSRGELTSGIVTAVGFVRRAGQSPITIQYTVDGKTLKSRRDMIRKDYAVGQTVQVLYDPQRPAVFDIIPGAAG